jgi:hypothetical protein
MTDPIAVLPDALEAEKRGGQNPLPSPSRSSISRLSAMIEIREIRRRPRARGRGKKPVLPKLGGI